MRPPVSQRLGSTRRRLYRALRNHALLPGPGCGVYCIPIDPHYLERKAREYSF